MALWYVNHSNDSVINPHSIIYCITLYSEFLSYELATYSYVDNCYAKIVKLLRIVDL